jgi:hypothetical protein
MAEGPPGVVRRRDGNVNPGAWRQQLVAAATQLRQALRRGPQRVFTAAVSRALELASADASSKEVQVGGSRTAAPSPCQQITRLRSDGTGGPFKRMVLQAAQDQELEGTASIIFIRLAGAIGTCAWRAHDAKGGASCLDELEQHRRLLGKGRAWSPPAQRMVAPLRQPRSSVSTDSIGHTVGTAMGPPRPVASRVPV